MHLLRKEGRKREKQVELKRRKKNETRRDEALTRNVMSRKGNPVIRSAKI
jgi:hypothetical protein